MDGGGRLLRSLGDFGGNLAPSPLAFAGSSDPSVFPVVPAAAPRLPPGRVRRGRLRGVERALASRFIGTCLVILLFGASAFYGAVRGGAYDAFVAENGGLPDVVARGIGFGIKSVTINGAHELRNDEILKLAGIRATRSLPFLNVADVRARLTAVPLIREATVTKLFPNRLLIEIEERQPYALWQKNGEVNVVAFDGKVIDAMRDARFERLPLVVGDGANERLAGFSRLLDVAGELRGRIRAGIFVSGRRWSLKMTNGVEIELPEDEPEAALARFALLEHDGHILDKDILSVDLRIKDRIVARLSEEAAAARAASLAAKSKKKRDAT